MIIFFFFFGNDMPRWLLQFKNIVIFNGPCRERTYILHIYTHTYIHTTWNLEVRSKKLEVRSKKLEVRS